MSQRVTLPCHDRNADLEKLVTSWLVSEKPQTQWLVDRMGQEGELEALVGLKPVTPHTREYKYLRSLLEDMRPYAKREWQKRAVTSNSDVVEALRAVMLDLQAASQEDADIVGRIVSGEHWTRACHLLNLRPTNKGSLE